MTEKEIKLFKELCKFQSDSFDKALIDAATPEVWGHIFNNRMQGIAYGVLKKHGLLNQVNREIRNALKSAHEQNMEKNSNLFKEIVYISNILNQCNCKYAMLKGAYLCKLYPEGYRTSNDIDILTMPKDVTKVGDALLRAGFKQGYIRNEVFVPATREEIIGSRIMRGECIPYIKETNLLNKKFLEVDINFSLDYKNSPTYVLEQMLIKSGIREIDGLSVPTLSSSDFFIHLCNHLYKEATTLPWIEMQRDMTLYKYCDIYLLLTSMSDKELTRLFDRAKHLGMDKVCAFAIYQTIELFDISNKQVRQFVKMTLQQDFEFLLRVISPKDKKSYRFVEKDIWKRFLSTNRKVLLEEIYSNEKT